MSRSSTTDAVVVGADIGGSTTRVAVATGDGRVLAECRGGPGNPVVVGVEASISTVGDTVTRALELATGPTAGDTPEVVRATIGLAGVTSLLHSPDAARFTTAVLPDTPVRLVSDFAVAFASGTWQDRGIVTIAGTGSGAMEIDRGSDVARRDAWGWLLGDDGSGFWLGREAVRSTLRQLEEGRAGALARTVSASLGAPDAAGVLAACYRRPPRDLADLAPAVVAAAADDSEAAVLLDRAAQLVSDRVLRLRNGRADLPVVVAGSLVTGTGPLAKDVAARLRDHGVSPVHEAGDGVAGALWLALRDQAAGPGADTSQKQSGDTAEPARQWSELLGSLGACRRTAPTHVEP